jgi:hypothetical protein
MNDLFGRHLSMQANNSGMTDAGYAASFATVTCSGTAAAGTDGAAGTWSCPTSATTGSVSAWSGSNSLRFAPNRQDVLHAEVSLAQTTNEELWIGMFGNGNSAGFAYGTAQTAYAVSFRYATTASDTDYVCDYYDTSNHVVDSTVAVSTSATEFEIWEDSSSKWHWAINGTEVCGSGTTVTIPNTTTMLPAVQFVNKTASSLTFAIGYLNVSTRW